MNENDFINMLNPSMMQHFNQTGSQIPFQNINFFPPTPPQQIHYYLEDQLNCRNNEPQIEEINRPNYNVEANSYNMSTEQNIFSLSLQMNQVNLLLTPSHSTETCSSKIKNFSQEFSQDFSQDFSLYPSTYGQHSTKQGASLTVSNPNSGYSHNDPSVYYSPRSSCSPNSYTDHQFTSYNSKKNKTTSLNKKKHYCPTCKKPFGRPQEVQRHQVIHTGERNFRCSKCPKTFARRDAMQRHFKSHMKDKTKNTIRISKASF